MNRNKKFYLTALAAAAVVIAMTFYQVNASEATAAEVATAADAIAKDSNGGSISTNRDKIARFVRPSAAEIKARLSNLQYKVTQKAGTEPPFKNEYWDNKRTGIYVDIVSGEPLFSSKDKFASGTGWPSFTQPVKGADIVEHTDRKFFFTRWIGGMKNGHRLARGVTVFSVCGV